MSDQFMSCACDTAEPRSRDAARVSPSLILIALVIFLPEELSFQVFGFRLSWIRFVLFLLTPVLAVRLGQLIATGKSRLLAPGIFVVLTGAWMIGASTAVSGLEDAFHHHTAGVAEISGSYLATRVLLSQRGQALSYVNLLCHVIAVVALFSIPDALMGGSVTHELLGQVLVNPERRWGLVRSGSCSRLPHKSGPNASRWLHAAWGPSCRCRGLRCKALSWDSAFLRTTAFLLQSDIGGGF